MTSKHEPQTTGSIDAALTGIEPRHVLDVLHKAIADIGKDQALHIRFYTGNLLQELPPYIERAKDLINGR